MLGSWLGKFFAFLSWLLFPSSTRARSIRLTSLVLLIATISVAALAFREIDIRVPLFPTLERGGDGPLGLKLGLDLRGGGHLVYQADSGTRINLSFNDNVIAAGIVTLAQGLGIDSSVNPRGNNNFLMKTRLLDDDTREKLHAALKEKFESLHTFEHEDIKNPTSDQMEGVLDIINRRVNLFGTEEPIIQRFGEDRIIVQLPGASGSITNVAFSDGVDREALRALLEEAELNRISIDQIDGRTFKIKSGTLNARRQNDLRNAMNDQLGTVQSFDVTSGIDEAKALIGQTARLEFKERTCTDPTCTTVDDADIGLTGDDLKSAYATTAQVEAGWVINIAFDDRGSKIFSDLTQKLVQQQNLKRIAVFLDDEELLAPVARAWIRDGRSQISGSSFDPFTREEAQTLSIQLESGRLPVPLKIIQESDVDALLGSESLRRSLAAGLVGLALVMVFMVAYYRMAGAVAAVALVFYTLIVLSIFKLVPITLTLSHIGGFILSIGMAVDANVLIFERMKEEVRIGRTLASSMEVGFNRAWPAIRDGNVSTIITCLVLIWVGDRLGGGLITGFAISLFIGVVVSMFTALVVSRNLLQLLAWVGLGRRISLFTPEGAPRAAGTLGRGA